MKIFLIFISFIFSNTALAEGRKFKCKVGELMAGLENGFQFELIDCENKITTPPACGTESVDFPVFDSSTTKGQVIVKSLLIAKARGKFVEGKVKNFCPFYSPDSLEVDYLNILDK
ncbi:MAG: hypothetical protein AB8G05_08320 [Oligoflexales bacterium]